MWFPVEPSDIDFTASAPFRFHNEAIVDVTPERAFEIWATGERQPEWFQDFVACRWTSPEPHGVGATREVELKTLTVKERFLVWEPGKRLAFTITGITIPLVRRMVEDLSFEPFGARTRFRWTAHYAPTLLMQAVHPVARALFGKMFAASTGSFTRYAGQSGRAG